MPRRDRDPRPPIEVFGGTLSEESVQEVAVGGGSGGARRGWQLVIAAVVLVVGIAAVTTNGKDGDDGAKPTTTTTRHRPPSTTTSTTLPAPLGPVLAAQTGASVLFLAQLRDWVLLDLDTGAMRSVPGGATDLFAGVLPVRGGLVVTDGTSATYRPVLTDGEPVALGTALAVLGSGDDELVWLLRGDEGGSLPSSAHLVDLRGREHGSRRVGQAYLPAATVDGPVMGDGGRAYVYAEEGLRPLGVGNPVAAAGGSVLLDTCTEAGRCGPVIVNVRTGERREVRALQMAAGRTQMASFALSPYGDVVESTYQEQSVHVRWVDPDGRLVGEGDLASTIGEFGGGFNGAVEFLPQGHGGVWLANDGAIHHVFVQDGDVLAEPLPATGMREVQRVMVLRP